MTVTYLLLAFFLITGHIARTISREMAAERTAADLIRLTAVLPHARQSLYPPHPDWPARQTPTDLPGIGWTEELASVELRSRVFLAAPAPVAVQVGDTGRHHIGVAAGTRAQQVRWNTPTGEFLTLVEAGWSEDERATLSREWWCESCLDDHRDCTGACACPCTLEVAAA